MADGLTSRVCLKSLWVYMYMRSKHTGCSVCHQLSITIYVVYLLSARIMAKLHMVITDYRSHLIPWKSCWLATYLYCWRMPKRKRVSPSPGRFQVYFACASCSVHTKTPFNLYSSTRNLIIFTFEKHHMNITWKCSNCWRFILKRISPEHPSSNGWSLIPLHTWGSTSQVRVTVYLHPTQHDSCSTTPWWRFLVLLKALAISVSCIRSWPKKKRSWICSYKALIPCSQKLGKKQFDLRQSFLDVKKTRICPLDKETPSPHHKWRPALKCNLQNIRNGT